MLVEPHAFCFKETMLDLVPRSGPQRNSAFAVYYAVPGEPFLFRRGVQHAYDLPCAVSVAGTESYLSVRGYLAARYAL